MTHFSKFLSLLVLAAGALNPFSLFSQEGTEESTAGYYAVKVIENEAYVILIKHFDFRPTADEEEILWVQEKELSNSHFSDTFYLSEGSDVGEIKKVRLEVDYNFKPKSTAYWFAGMGELEEIIGLENLNTSEVTSMEGMFKSSYSLSSINLSNFNTSNVTNMSYMFASLSSLNSLDLSSFNTANVTNMERMFYSCRTNAINLSSFNTESVTNMIYMFSECYASALDLSSFNTEKVEDMQGMFSGCRYLTTLDLSSFDLTNVTNFSYIFNGCSSLEYIFANEDSKISLSKDTNTTYAFLSTFNLVGVKTNGESVNPTSKERTVKDSKSFFAFADEGGLFTKKTNVGEVEIKVLPERRCYVGEELDLRGVFLTRKVAFGDICIMDIHLCDLSAFYNTIKGFDTEKVGTLTHSINYGGKRISFEINVCDRYFATVEVEGEDTVLILKPHREEPVVDAERGILNVVEVDPTYDDDDYTLLTPDMYSISPLGSAIKRAILEVDEHFKPIRTAYWFEGLENLEEIIGLENLNTSESKYMTRMFQGCYSLKTLDLSGFNTEKVEDMSGMFGDCLSLEKLDLSSFNTEKVSSMAAMFAGCSTLKALDLINFNTSNVLSMDIMFADCYSLEKLNISSFRIDNVLDMSLMFAECSSLETLDLSGFTGKNDPEIGIEIFGMFEGCSSLRELDISNFTIANISMVSSMFSRCASLEYIDISGFNLSSMPDPYGMFDSCINLKYIFADEQTIGLRNEQYSEYGNLLFANCDSLRAVASNGDIVEWNKEIDWKKADKNIAKQYFNYADEGGYITKKKNLGEAEIGILPTKTQYFCGEELDLSGGYITRTIVFGKEDTLRLNLCRLETLASTVEGFDIKKSGEQEVSVRYCGKKYSFKVQVKDFLKEITVTSKPSKTEYQKPFTEEDLDLSGGEICKLYASDSTAVLAMNDLEYTIRGLDTAKLGEQSLEIEFVLGDTTFVWEYKINVLEAAAEDSTGSGDDPIVAMEDLEAGGAAFEAWTAGGVLSVKVARGGVLEVLGVNGALVRRVEVAAGGSVRLPLERGVYVLRMGGEVKKVVVE